ncbi:MAG: hypothetical protein Q7K35_05975 [bacterium]|nr:hypothetical protein [bacterium]
MLIEPRADLYDRIINRINREEKLMILKRRLIIEFLGSAMSLLFFIPLTIRLLSDLAKSGLAEFSSLLFTDFGLIMSNIGDYVLTILESTPALSLSLTLAALLALVFSVAKMVDSYGDFRKIAA